MPIELAKLPAAAEVAETAEDIDFRHMVTEHVNLRDPYNSTVGGFQFSQQDKEALIKFRNKLGRSPEGTEGMYKYNRRKGTKKFTADVVR